MPIQAILFDHDGTLVDSESTHLELWRRAIAPYGGYITDEEYWRLLLGVPAEQNAALLIQLRGLAADAATLVSAKLAHTDRFLAQGCFAQMPQADRVVRALAAQLRLGLVSGSQRRCVEASLRGHGWEALFEQVVTGDEVRRNKPHPDSYLRALALMQLEAADCLAIEDTQSGVRAAAAAGLATIAIRNRHSASHDFSAAAVEVPDLPAALDWIEQQRR